MTEEFRIADGAISAWKRLAHEGRYPAVQFGPTEPNGEPMWCVSLVNPATIEFFDRDLKQALLYAEHFGERLVRSVSDTGEK